MSIATAIQNAQEKVENSYTAVSTKGGTIPATQNLSNLPAAILSIPQSGGGASIEALNITPTTSQQIITASGLVDGYSPITVDAVDSSIDPNILSNNIAQGVTILGVSGSAVFANLTGCSITPSTTSQTIYPTSPYTGFDQVDVEAVSSSIDANIQAGNIKDGVTILGVTGNYKSGSTTVTVTNNSSSAISINDKVWLDTTSYTKNCQTTGLTINPSTLIATGGGTVLFDTVETTIPHDGSIELYFSIDCSNATSTGSTINIAQSVAQVARYPNGASAGSILCALQLNTDNTITLGYGYDFGSGDTFTWFDSSSPYYHMQKQKIYFKYTFTREYQSEAISFNGVNYTTIYTLSFSNIFSSEYPIYYKYAYISIPAFASTDLKGYYVKLNGTTRNYAYTPASPSLNIVDFGYITSSGETGISLSNIAVGSSGNVKILATS